MTLDGHLSPGELAHHADEASFLAGGGAMGELVRAIDWSTRALGPLDEWPQSLRTAVSICLNSRFPIALYWGPQFVMLYNESLLPMVGANKHPRAMGRPAFEVLPEIREIIEPLLQHVRATGEATWSEDLMLPLVRGVAPEESYFTFTYSPVRDESGGIGGVFCAVMETTDKVIEERRLRLLNVLTSAKRAPSPVEACREAATMLKEATADVPLALIYLFDDAAREATLAGAANVEAGSASAPSVIRLGDALVGSFDLARETGEPVFVELGTAPFATSHAVVVLPMEQSGRGEPLGFVVAGLSPLLSRGSSYERFHTLLSGAISQCVSNAASYDAERRRAESLAELDHAKTAFFSNVSHEFRTPLTLMLGPLEELAASSRIPEAERMVLQGVHRNSQRILKLVNTLLDFSRIEAGKMHATFEATDLASLTAGLASAFESMVSGAGMRLVVNCPPLAEPVYVDRDMWEKIVLNLVSNAFKFTFEGQITVRLRLLEGEVELSVGDTGTGIAEIELPRIFDRFHRVEGAKGRSYEGSGIGLALVQELVKLHGGSIQLESVLGRGTTFRVFLPVGANLPARDVQAAPRSIASSTAAAAFVDEAAQWPSGPPAFAYAYGENRLNASSPEDPSNTRSGRVLVADDNADMRDYVRRTLGDVFLVETVADGQAALESARASPPDLVLSDVMMPGLDGFGLLRELQRDSRTAHVPVILLSARAGEEATVGGLAAGAMDYLAKPFSARELRARVEGAVRATQDRAERARLLREVEAANQRLESLFANAPTFVCALRGPHHTYELINPPYQQLVGAGRKLLGLTVEQALPEAAEQGFVALLDEVYRTGQTYVGRETLFRVDRRGSGLLEDAFVTFIFQARRDARGQVSGIDVFGFEVTDQVLARTKAESLSADLRLADQRKDEFLAMLAHELRNPMAAISLALSMLERTQGDPVKTAKHRDTARRQMGNLVRLVDDLLDVSRITSGKVELRKEGVDLVVLVQNALAAARLAIEARRHELSVMLASGSFRLQADPTRLEQVVVNLLTNAAKYTEPGGSLFLRLVRDEAAGMPHAILSVRDSGRGIPGEMLDKIFGMFVQVSPTIDRSTGGLGLGLTLVKRLVEMHGGSVLARSEGPGKGSEFVVRLPLETQASSPLPAAERYVPPPAVAKRRVLIVEDSEDLRESLKDYLEGSGHEVQVAVDGLEGLRKAIDRRPDVSLVDVGLPGIDGYELARRIRSEPGGEKLFLVALTGYGGPEAKAKAEAAGFDLHLTKPVNIDELPFVLNRSRLNH